MGFRSRALVSDLGVLASGGCGVWCGWCGLCFWFGFVSCGVGFGVLVWVLFGVAR